MAFVWPGEHEAQRGEGTCPAPSPSLPMEDTCCPHSGTGGMGPAEREPGLACPGTRLAGRPGPCHASAGRLLLARGAPGRTAETAHAPCFSGLRSHVSAAVTMALNLGLAGAEFSWGRRGDSGLPARAGPVLGAGCRQAGLVTRAPSPGGDGQRLRAAPVPVPAAAAARARPLVLLAARQHGAVFLLQEHGACRTRPGGRGWETGRPDAWPPSALE